MKIETTTGKYAVIVNGEIRPEKVMELAVDGLCQGQLYRGVFAPARDYTGAKRKMEDSAAFDTALGERLRGDVAVAIRPFVTDATTVSVVEYVGGESSDSKPTKEATEMWSVLQSKPDHAEFAAKCKLLGIDPEEGDDDKAIIAIRDFMRKARADAAEKAKGLLG